MDRRRFIQASAAGVSAAALWPLGSTGATTLGSISTPLPKGVVFDKAPFGLGVASGDPLADRVIICPD